PAEMGASFHINGTGSSIIDTVFVCRATGRIQRSTLAKSAPDLANLVRSDLFLLKEGGVKPTLGDTRCIALGHLTRMAIWTLRSKCKPSLPSPRRLAAVRDQFLVLGGIAGILSSLDAEGEPDDLHQLRLAVTEPS